jgi:hypothetical protein
MPERFMGLDAAWGVGFSRVVVAAVQLLKRSIINKKYGIIFWNRVVVSLV